MVANNVVNGGRIYNLMPSSSEPINLTLQELIEGKDGEKIGTIKDVAILVINAFYN